MGEARRRGDYEKRKTEAITAGRVRTRPERKVRLMTGPELLASILLRLGVEPKKKIDTAITLGEHNE